MKNTKRQRDKSASKETEYFRRTVMPTTSPSDTIIEPVVSQFEPLKASDPPESPSVHTNTP
jgi:hypothetical protein